MLQIAEIKIVDGELWARLDIKLQEENGPITLWNNSEIAAHDRQLVQAVIEAIRVTVLSQ